jgi:hypothetical protein
VARSRQRAIRTCDFPPGIGVRLVHIQLVEELRHGAIVVLTSEQEDLIVARGIGDDGGAGTGRRRVRDLLSDFVKLLLLFLVLGEDGINIAVFGIAVVRGRASGFGLFVFLGGFLFLLLGYASLFGVFALFGLFLVFRHGDVIALSMEYSSSCALVRCVFCYVRESFSGICRVEFQLLESQFETF